MFPLSLCLVCEEERETKYSDRYHRRYYIY